MNEPIFNISALNAKSVSILKGKDFDEWLKREVPKEYHKSIRSHRLTYISALKHKKRGIGG